LLPVGRPMSSRRSGQQGAGRAAVLAHLFGGFGIFPQCVVVTEGSVDDFATTDETYVLTGLRD